MPLRNAWEPKWGCSISIAGKDRLDWALVLGASGGFGAATSRALAADGLNIFGVHLDRRATLPLVDQVVSDIESHGRTARFFNSNAVQDDARQAVIAAMIAELGEGSHLGRLRAVLHSIAFGNLLPYVSDGDSQAISPAQMEMTFNAMAHSLVYWVRDLVDAGLLANGGRVFAMTSEGATKIWPHYGAVSAVKATLDAHVRRLAFELAPKGITVNAIRAGVTDTAASRVIGGSEELLARAAQSNPSGRLTTPEDIAGAIAVLCDDRTHWITGNVIGVDGGEVLTS